MGALIVVCGGVSGQPAAVVAANLAAALAVGERRKTLLMASPQCEVEEWDVLLGMKPGRSLDDLLSLADALNADVLQGYLPRHACGVDLLGSSRRGSIEPGAFDAVLTALRAAYARVVVPLPAPAPAPVTDMLLAAASHIVIPVDPDLLQVQYASAFITGLRRRHINTRVCVPAIMDQGGPGQLDQATIESLLGVPAQTRIPVSSEGVAAAVSRGTPTVLAQPASPGARAYAALAALLAHEPAASTAPEAESAAPDILALKRRMHEALVDALKKFPAGTPQDIVRGRARDLVAELLSSDAYDLPRAERPRFIADIMDETFGYGCIEEFMRDPAVTEIMVNGPDTVFVEKQGKIFRTTAQFTSNRQLMAVIDRIVAPVGRRIDESSPLVDARLPDGSRVNAVIPPVALSGPSLTIRKFSRRALGMDDLIGFGALSPAMAAYLRACVLLRKNILISGGTGSGKTTLLNVVAGFIPVDERIVTIEDAAELRLPQEHVVSMEARPPSMEGKGAIPIRRLVVNALRMRPDRIIVGECRAGEALDMLQAMNTGHDGSLTTLHANSPRDALTRLATMVLMAGTELPERAVRDQISAAIDVIVQLSRMPDGSRKVIAVTELRGIEQDRIVDAPLFSFERTGMCGGKVAGRFTATGTVSGYTAEAASSGIPLDPALFATGGGA